MIKMYDFQSLYHQNVVIIGRAGDDAVYGQHSQLSFDVDHAHLDDGQQLTGKLEISGFGPNAVYQGDELEISGQMYPGFGTYQGSISYAKLVVIAHNPSLAAELRRKFASGVQSALPEPLGSFVMGLLIGQRTNLPDQVKQDLLMVGLTHIIAVSGYNLTIILNASKEIFGRRSKRLATLISICLIGVFLLFSGFSASIVRAAIVSMLSIAATYYGRSFKPLGLILLAAAVTAWASPQYVWSDISWWLSFLAFYGVMIVGPLFSGRLAKGWQHSVIVAVVIETLAAEIMTLPFILHNFGQMSLVSLPANILITTLVPLAMLFGFIAGLAGMLMGGLSGWLTLPAKVLLTYMLDTAHLLAHIPHIFIQNIGFSLVQMLICYVMIVFMSWLLINKTNDQLHGKITDKQTDYSKGSLHERTQQMVNYQTAKGR